MPTTIDKAGRIVIPAQLRRKAGFKPGTPLAASYEDGAIRIVRDVPGPTIERRGKRRIAKASTKAAESPDLASMIEEERDRWPQ